MEQCAASGRACGCPEGLGTGRPPAGDLRLVRADTLLSAAATAPALPEVEFELLPEIVAPEIVAPVSATPAAEPGAATPAVVEQQRVTETIVARAPEPTVETVVERTPANVELVSHEEQPAAVRGEVDIINPDRTMPVVSNREVSPLEMPAPIRDFAPTDAALEPVASRASKTPLFIGLGLVAAAAAVVGFFVLKPSGAASPEAAGVSRSATVQASPQSPASQPQPATTEPVAATTPPTGASTGLGGDVQARKPKKGDDASREPATASSRRREVLPAAPSLGKIGDAAALPTVDAGVARNDAAARAQALEKARRAIDSSMRSKPDSQ